MEIALLVGAVVRVPGHFHGDITFRRLEAIPNNGKAIGQDPVIAEMPLAQQARVTAEIGDDTEFGHVGLEP